MEDAALIATYVENALSRLRKATDNDVRLLRGATKLRIKNGRAVLYVAFELERPSVCPSAEAWVQSLADYVLGESGYGQAEVILDQNGEVVGGRVEVSYDLKSF